MNDKIALYQYGPQGFKTPSSSPDCLHIQALLKFSEEGLEQERQEEQRKEVTLINWNDNNRSNTKKLPVMMVGEGGDDAVVVSGVKECVRHLRGVIPHVFGDNSADDAFCAFVDRMNLILKFNWFKETENYEWLKNEVFYEEFSAFPFKYYNSYLKKTEMDSLLTSQDLTEHKRVYEEANDCYFLLADRLGNRPYFGGNYPNHLDAAVFSHLAIALFSPLPKKQLSAAIQRKPELVDYVINILQKYWSLKISVPVTDGSQEDEAPQGKIWNEIGIPVFIAFSCFSVYIVGSHIPARIQQMLSEN